MTTPKEALELKPCPFCGGIHISDRHVRDGRQMFCIGCGSSVAPTFHGPRGDTLERAKLAWNTRATASLEGDAVERVALAEMVFKAIKFADMAAGEGIFFEGLDPAEILSNYATAIDTDCWDGIAEVARAILATGLVPDEAASPRTILSSDCVDPDIEQAIRADEREKCAKVADGIMYPDFEKSSDIEKHAYDIRCSIAAAIRSNRREA